MDRRHPTDKLSAEEIAEVKAIVDAKGKLAATHALGLRDVLAMAKAAAGFEVHRLTAATIRAALAKETPNAST